MTNIFAGTFILMSLGESLVFGFKSMIIGMLIVFLVLFLIVRVLGLFRHLGNNDKVKESSSKASEVREQQPIEITQGIEVPEETLEDETELVAIITAAIAASLNTTTDQLVVKSYKRVSRRKLDV